MSQIDAINMKHKSKKKKPNKSREKKKKKEQDDDCNCLNSLTNSVRSKLFLCIIHMKSCNPPQKHLKTAPHHTCGYKTKQTCLHAERKATNELLSVPP